MQVKCEYCGAYINDTDKFCTQCGAVNDNLKRSTDGTPTTIGELKKWYKDRNLPPEDVTRFYIGTDYKGARAFGIYESEGNFIVYKNKGDGTRAIRYQGPDEAYAVNEIYLKLKSEILNQKAHNIENESSGPKNGKPVSKFKSATDYIFGILCLIVFAGAIIFSIINAVSSMINHYRDVPYAGNYYSYDDNIYYCESYVYDEWYSYDPVNRDYVPVYLPDEMYDNINDFRYAEDEEWDSDIERFEDTPMGEYVEEQRSSSSDSSYDWSSSDSWDSGDTDWDSDW